MSVIKKVHLQGLEAAKARIREMISRGKHPEPLFRDVAGIMDREVEDNFAAGGRDPQWPESKRVKKHGGQTLIDSAQLVNSIQDFVTDTSAGVATNKEYAAIHNDGGEIKRGPSYITTRLRTDARGNLLRQGTEGTLGNLAVFAKASHKRVRTRFRFNSGYSITMPQREFMKVSPAGVTDIEDAAQLFFTGG